MTQKPKLNQNTWQTVDRSNAYFQFIEECRIKQYASNATLHVHHIIPQYVLKKTSDGLAYLNTPENLVVLSDEDHLKAHALLYEIYGNPSDKGACLLLKGQQTESRAIWRKLGAEATHRIQKKNGTTVYNADWQREMAARSMARPDALETRSRGGKVGGRTRNRDRAIKQDESYVFSFEKREVLCIINCRTGGEVLEQLNLYAKTPLQRVTPLLNGSRKSLHGWSCVKIK